MAGLTDILYTARDAIAAQSYGLGVTGQNVANVNTPGYVRRRAELSSHPLGDASFGTVVVDGVSRLSDQYVEQRHYAALGMSASAGESDRMLGYIESLFDISSGQDIGSALSDLFASFSTVSSDPSNLSARAQALGRAEVFASRLNDTASQIARFRTDLTEQAIDAADQVNSLTSDIAKMTQQIQTAEAGDHDASDLRDKRDQLILGLSELVNVHTFTNEKGALVIQGAGTTLVEGGESRALKISLADGGTLKVSAVSKNGAATDVSAFLTSGRLGAIKDLHDVHTVEVLGELDQFAYDVATTLNAQHSEGFGLDGSTGLALFDVGVGTVEGMARGLRLNKELRAEQLGASDDPSGVPGNGANAILLSQLSAQKFAQGGTRTAAESYGALISDVGGRKATAAQDVVVREGIEAQLFAMRESTSGVNLDEEMVALTKYQRAFQAASKVLNTADELLAELMNLIK